MSDTRTCGYCGHGYHFSQSLCPHCARPANYPNVYAAQDGDEAAALEGHYQHARRAAQSRGAGILTAIERFEDEVSNARAIVARPGGELQRLSTSDNEVYATFYQWLDAGVRLPSGEKWGALRRVTDEALFPGYRDHIRFAALSLDGAGLTK